MRLLDDAALERVYVDLVRPLLFEDLSASAAPELIMVGGQPGAGKTAATVRAVRDLMRHGGGVNGCQEARFFGGARLPIRRESATCHQRTD